ncbi:gamma-glutamylcyclotransferase family protein [Methylogaea oryzae]|uniref:Putative gamma-glutamylcyclotransferase n=1 Tax=Methylogaea oryzae TaxID=1295382 RepID=A0A8D5AHV1_9GAMM|nr:gamma-glutamylcyclotransferase family protein [Methylogaea oryzae]BBL70661.1 hypothetical protein MoryE10_12670 [Methylogaea oryzae]
MSPKHASAREMRRPQRKSSVPLFAYGTLLLPEVMRAVTGRQPVGQPARLEGYACRLLRKRPYPGIRPSPGAVTTGLLYWGLDRRAWRRLDAFEDDDCYGKAIVTVLDGASRRHQAVAYAVKAKHYGALSALPWSAEKFRRQRLCVFLAALRRGRLGC